MTWLPVCRYDDLQSERGAAALLGTGQAGTVQAGTVQAGTVQVAVFRTFDGALYAIGNQDPFTGAFVLSRGIVGTRGGIPTVASPLHKQVFDLRTGVCLDDPGIAVPVFPVRRRDGRVEVEAEVEVSGG